MYSLLIVYKLKCVSSFRIMWIIYGVIAFLLLMVELVYFKVADKYSIIDKPNERSSHKTIVFAWWRNYLHHWALDMEHCIWIPISVAVGRCYTCGGNIICG